MQTLAGGARRRILRRAPIAELQAALKANRLKTSDPVQTALSDFLGGRRIEIAGKSYDELWAIAKVAGWVRNTVEDVPSDLLPDASDLRHAVEHAALIDGFEQLAGPHFQGRQSELKELRDYIGVQAPEDFFGKVINVTREVLGWHRKSPLVISGPGGIGKSTLLARVLLEHFRAQEEFRFPFVYIDFDRIDVLANEPLTILSEAARQIGYQYDEARGAADDLRQMIRDELMTESFGTEDASTMPSEVGAIVLRRNTEPFIKKLGELLDAAKLSTTPFVLVLDTFERVQYQGSDIVRELWRFFDRLGDVVERLRVVIAGRAPVEDADGVDAESLPLRNFDRESAIGFLHHLMNSKPPVSHELMEEIYDQVGGNPLSLRLAINVVQSERLGADQLQGIGAHRLLRVFIREEKIQGQLYRRILGHIKNNELRKLAYPGLILRRFDAPVIKEILAAPCGVKVRTLEDAEALLAEFKKEVSLVSVSPDGSLRHRPEIRQVMLDDLKQAGGKKIDLVQRRAIRFYAELSDREFDDERIRIFRTEEIYHRLSLGQSAATVQNRWIQGLEQRLAPDLDELPAAGRALLAAKLGRELDSDALEAADLEVWEQSVSRTVMRMLHRGDPKQALEIIQQREQRSEASPLFALEATAYLARDEQGDVNDAQSVVERGLASVSRAANADVLTDLLLVQAKTADRLGEYAEQHHALREAFELATRRNDGVGTLRAGVELQWHADSHEWSLDEDGGNSHQELIRAFEGLSRKEVVANPRMSRRLAVLVGEEQPQVLHRVLKSVGLGSLNSGDLESFANRLKEHASEQKGIWPIVDEIGNLIQEVSERESTSADDLLTSWRTLVKKTSKSLADHLKSSASDPALLSNIVTLLERTLDDDEPRKRRMGVVKVTERKLADQK